MADELEAGAAYISLMASGRGLQSDVSKQVRKVKAPDIVAKIDAKIEALEKKAATARAKLEQIKKGVDAQVGLDIAELEAKAAVVRQRLDDLRRREATPKVRADIAAAEAQIGRIDRKLAELRAKSSEVKVTADTVAAQANVERVEGQIRRLQAQRANVQVDADGTAQTTSELQGVQRAAAAVNGQKAGVFVTETGSANAASKLLLVVSALGAVGEAAPAALGALAAGTGGLGALAQAALSTVGGLAGIGDALDAVESQEKSAATSSGQAASQRRSSMRSIQQAASGLQQAQTQQARTAIQGDQQVASAARGVAQARAAAARTQVQGAQQVASAQRALQAAQIAADRAAIQGAQQVAAARRALASAQLSAARSVEDAQRSYVRSVQQERYAQEDVTRARRDAQRALVDLQLQLSGAALSEERAAINLARAQEKYAAAMAAGMPDGLAKQEMSLDVREAQQALAETRNRTKNLKEDQAEWARTGVEGSQQVVAAQRALQAAQESVADSARQVSRAQVDGARQVQDAQIALAQAVQQAGWAQQDAARGVRDAEIALSEARQAAAWANQDAARQVADAELAYSQAVQQAQWANADAARQVAEAQAALADAYAAAGEAGAAGADQAAYALSKLSPAGREFVRFMTQEWKPAIERVGHATAEEMLPRVQTAMRNLLALEPVVRQGMVQTGRVVGDLAIKGSTLAASPPFQASFASIMSSNARTLESYGNAGLSMFGAVTDLLTVAGPYGEEIARMVDYSAQAAETWLLGARTSGQLDAALRTGTDTLYFIVGVLRDAATGTWGLLQGLAPLGGAVLSLAGNAALLIGNLASWNPTITSIVAGAGLGYVALSRLGTAMSVLALAQGATGIRALGNVLGTVLNPAALYTTATMTRLGAGFTAAGSMAGALVGGMTGSSRAALGTDKAVRMAGTAVRGLASALPLVGVAAIGAMVANDAMNSSFEEGVEATRKGGLAQQQFQAELARNDAAMAKAKTAAGGYASYLGFDWVRQHVFGIQSSQQFNAQLDAEKAKMSELERAQFTASQAQGNYERALAETGPTSQRTADAQRALATATNDVEREQNEARLATMNATQALQDQQNKILAAIDARLGERQAVQSTKDAQKALADAIAQGGPGSDAAAQASLRLEQAQSSQAQAAVRAATEEAKRRGETDTSRAATDALGRSVGQMVAATQGQLSPALVQMVNGLDRAGLSAAGAQLKVDAAGRTVATFPNGKTVVLDANTSPVFTQVAQAKALVDATRGTIGVDADTGPGVAKVGGFKLVTDATTGVVTINGNISPAEQQRLGIKAKTDGTQGTITINGQSVPADGRLNGLKVRVDQTTGVMTIDGNPNPATDASTRAHNHANTPAGFQISADTRPAENSSRGFFGWLNAQLRDLESKLGFNWTQRMLGRPGYADGGLVELAQGGVAELARGGRVQGFPGGGRVRGAGTSTSDSIPAALSNNEYVVKAAAVRRVGVPALDAINSAGPGAASVARESITRLFTIPDPATRPGLPNAVNVLSGAGGALDAAASALGTRGRSPAGPAAPAPIEPIRPVRAAGGGLVTTSHRYDLASQVAPRRPAPSLDTGGGDATRGDGTTINQTFTRESVTAREGFEAANYAVAKRS